LCRLVLITWSGHDLEPLCALVRHLHRKKADCVIIHDSDETDEKIPVSTDVTSYTLVVVYSHNRTKHNTHKQQNAMSSNNNDQEITVNTNISSMSSIQMDLEELENQLGSNNMASTGRAVFRSINSALGNIRNRIERATDTTDTSTSSSSVAANSGFTNRLMDRLRRAELAHSSRIPLDRLQSVLSRRQSAADTPYIGRTNEATSSDQNNFKNELQRSTVEGESLPRRESVLLASRRRAEELQSSSADIQLHKIVSSTQIADTDIIMEDHEESHKDGNTFHTENETDTAEIATILLTQKSRSSMDQLQQSVLFPERSPQLEATTTTTSSILYSWGLGINSFHENGNDVPLIDARVSSDSRAGRMDIISCSVGEHHAACTTASGQVLIVGSNTSGEVDPDRTEDKCIAKPTILESIIHARVIQVSCGFDHTAALHSNGSVLTWGSNEYGQLGHHSTYSQQNAKMSFCRPAAMVLGSKRHATAVACGDGFTLCLTTRMSVLVCGIKEIAGKANNDTINNVPQTIPALEDLPLVGIAAGRRHAAVWTAHGSAFVWGENYFGACGREYPKKLSVPVPIKVSSRIITEIEKFLPHPLSNWAYKDSEHHMIALPDDVAVVYVACGSSHTVVVTRSGDLFVCGANSHGQLGLDPKQFDKSCLPQPFHHPINNRRFSCAAAGENHTILLDDFGDVWQMGGSISNVGCTQCLVGKAVCSVGAGGNQSVAVAARPGRSLMTREFSDAIITVENFQTTGCVEELIDTVAGTQILTEEEENNRNVVVTKITTSAEELFQTPAVLNSLFIDPKELDDLFAKLLSIDSSTVRQTIVSAIERGIRKGIESLDNDGTRFLWPEQVRFLLLYIQTPMFTTWMTEGSIFDRRGDLILSLCEKIIGIPYEGYTAMMCWATTVYPRNLFERLLIQPLLAQLNKAMSVEAGAERRPIPFIVAVLRWLYNASTRAGDIVSPDVFYCDAISKMHPQLLYKDLERYKAASKNKQVADFFFCEYTFLFSPSTKRNLLQVENEMNMLKIAATGLTYNAQEHAYVFNPYYVLDIDREHLLPQTLQKISKAEPSDLRKKLRVVFKGEDGVDGKFPLV
jgi:alpha-tubulin suppressor-like RCC1 family protein